MAARDTYNASVSSAAQTQANSNYSAATAYQASDDAAGVNASSIPAMMQAGNSSYIASIKTAIITKQNALLAAEQAKQAAIAVARDTLRNTGGDSAPF